MSIIPQLAVREQVQLTVISEKLGFDSAWWPDHTVFVDGAPGIDCWTVMAAAAMQTRKIQLGTAVSDPHRTHPAVFAQRAATLDQLSRGRLLMGLGSGEAMNLEPFGIAWQERKVGRLREFIQVVRHLLDSKQPFDFEGSFYQMRQAALTVHPHQDRKIPLYLAALGPQMQRLAGQVADGWMPVVIPAVYYRHYLDRLDQQVLEAGRNPASLDRTCNLVFALLEDHQKVDRATLIEVLRPFAGVLVWEAAVRQMGLPWDPPEHLRNAGFHQVNPLDPESLRRYVEYCHWIPEEILTQFIYIGTRREIRKVVREFVDAGVTHFLVTNASADPVTSNLWFAREVMPEFTGRRPGLLVDALSWLARPFARLGLTRKLVPADVDIWKKAGL